MSGTGNGKKDGKEFKGVFGRGGCTRTDWDHPCGNVQTCGRAALCTDKYKTGAFPKKGFLKFKKKK
ncbi:MAG: hypothetical protein HZA03_02515 [Nitrospinae bacterium]|nr:hypothetical protein [Nitrospinota bacterium]